MFGLPPASRSRRNPPIPPLVSRLHEPCRLCPRGAAERDYVSLTRGVVCSDRKQGHLSALDSRQTRQDASDGAPRAFARRLRIALGRPVAVGGGAPRWCVLVLEDA